MSIQNQFIAGPYLGAGLGVRGAAPSMGFRKLDKSSKIAGEKLKY